MERWDLQPKNWHDILIEPQKNTPIFYDGRKYFGNTKWSLSWRFETAVNGYCVISTLTTKIEETYTMPGLAEVTRHFSPPELTLLCNTTMEKL